MIRTYLAILWAVIYLTGSIPVQIYAGIVGKKDPAKRDRITMRQIQWTFGVLLKICGTKIEVRGRENIPEAGDSVLYISNHRSYFDIVATYVLMKGPTGYVAKQEFRNIPIFMTWMKYVHCLFLDRKDPKKAIRTMNSGVDELKKGVSLWICPEGTRTKTDSELEMMDFKAGSFKLAEKSKRPVLPVALTGTRNIYEGNGKFGGLHKIRKAHIIIEFGKPIPTEGMSPEERKELPERTRGIILEMLKVHQNSRKKTDA